MESKYNELLQEKADLANAGKAVYRLCEDEERDLTSEEKKADDKAHVRMVAVNAELLEMDRERAQGSLETPVAGWFGGGEEMDMGRHQRSPGPAYQPTGRTYRELFGGAPSLGAWKSGEDFFAALHSGLANPLLIQATATEGSPGGGGFSVPEQLVGELLDASLEGEIVRPRAHVMPMASATRKVFGFDASSASGSTLFGGFSGGWYAEASEVTPETPELRLIELVAKKLALLAQVSNELIADGMSYGESLQAAMVKAIGWFLDDAFLNGTGAGQPLGVLNDPALIAVAKETGQAADTIDYNNLTKMFAQMLPGCRGNSVWVVSNTCIPELSTLGVLIGVAGSHIPVMTSKDGGFEILTRPVLFTEKVPAIGDQGDISLVDFSQYYVGLRQGMSLDRSQHVGFTRDTTYYRGILRADGMGKWSQAYEPKTGDSMSWCVTLAERA